MFHDLIHFKLISADSVETYKDTSIQELIDFIVTEGSMLTIHWHGVISLVIANCFMAGVH